VPQALPGGDETDFIMVGCAGIPHSVTDMAQHEKMMASKRRGDALVCHARGLHCILCNNCSFCCALLFLTVYDARCVMQHWALLERKYYI